MTGKSELLRRVAQVLFELEMLAEAPAASDFDAKPAIRHLKPSSGGPKHIEATARHHHDALERWCDHAEKSVRAERRGAGQKAETPEQFRFRIIEKYEGNHYADVADYEKVSVSYVRKIRIEAGRDPKHGKVAAKAA